MHVPAVMYPSTTSYSMHIFVSLMHTNRRALPWDPNIGEEAGELDAYVRFLITKLLSSLQHKGITYARDAGADAMVRFSFDFDFS